MYCHCSCESDLLPTAERTARTLEISHFYSSSIGNKCISCIYFLCDVIRSVTPKVHADNCYVVCTIFLLAMLVCNAYWFRSVPQVLPSSLFKRVRVSSDRTIAKRSHYWRKEGILFSGSGGWSDKNSDKKKIYFTLLNNATRCLSILGSVQIVLDVYENRQLSRKINHFPQIEYLSESRDIL